MLPRAILISRETSTLLPQRLAFQRRTGGPKAALPARREGHSARGIESKSDGLSRTFPPRVAPRRRTHPPRAAACRQLIQEEGCRPALSGSPAKHSGAVSTQAATTRPHEPETGTCLRRAVGSVLAGEPIVAAVISPTAGSRLLARRTLAERAPASSDLSKNQKSDEAKACPPTGSMFHVKHFPACPSGRQRPRPSKRRKPPHLCLAVVRKKHQTRSRSRGAFTRSVPRMLLGATFRGELRSPGPAPTGPLVGIFRGYTRPRGPTRRC